MTPGARQVNAMLQDRHRKQPVATWLQGNTLSLKRLAADRPWLARRRFWAAALAGTVLIAGGATALNLSRSAKQALSLNTYTSVAEEGSLPGLITASGELEAFRLVNVSPKRQGVLKTLYVEEGDSVQSAVVQASRERFRAVFITSATTAAGMLPLLLETSLQAQVLKPLVISVVFGIFTSTALVLFMIPAFYSVLDDFGKVSFAGRTKPAEEASVAKAQA